MRALHPSTRPPCVTDMHPAVVRMSDKIKAEETRYIYVINYESEIQTHGWREQFMLFARLYWQQFRSVH